MKHVNEKTARALRVARYAMDDFLKAYEEERQLGLSADYDFTAVGRQAQKASDHIDGAIKHAEGKA